MDRSLALLFYEYSAAYVSPFHHICKYHFLLILSLRKNQDFKLGCYTFKPPFWKRRVFHFSNGVYNSVSWTDMFGAECDLCTLFEVKSGRSDWPGFIVTFSAIGYSEGSNNVIPFTWIVIGQQPVCCRGISVLLLFDIGAGVPKLVVT